MNIFQLESVLRASIVIPDKRQFRLQQTFVALIMRRIKQKKIGATYVTLKN